MTQRLAATYPKHIETLCRRHDAALEASGFARVVLHSGASRLLYMDDNATPFRANPPFKAWVPLVSHPDCYVVYKPGRKPALIYYQPADYWHSVPQPPSGYWPEAFDVTVVDTREQALAALPGPGADTAWLGEADHCPGDREYALNPPRLASELDFARACKTDYEIACLRDASAIGARAHAAAKAAFYAGRSEFDIHMAYCTAAGQGDNELPYTNIVALNENAATLHYTALKPLNPPSRQSLLIDAGAAFNGYASDITRTYSADSEAFASLVNTVEEIELALCELVTPGRSYVDIHEEAHRLVAVALADHGLVTCSAETALDRGLTRVFFPHGIGHFIGLQVHDVGGHQGNPQGDPAPPPEAHPFLRLTRTLEAGHVVTIEPGIYVIDQLLDEVRGTDTARDIHWDAVDMLRPFGGVRVEDNVVCTSGEPENLTRNAFAALQG
ncbi:MAG: Xaa-Pro dipeptidase [Pseudomonadota bacterium]